MKTYKAVFNTDQVNRNQEIFPAAVLDQSLRQGFEKGMPSLMGHDSHRPVGWAFPTYLHFQQVMTRTCGQFCLPETDEEKDQIQSAYQQHLFQKKGEPKDSLSKNLLVKKLQEQFGIEKSTYELRNLNCVCAYKKDILWDVFPDLKPLRDKHGLTYWKNFKYGGEGLFEKDGLIVFASHFFRRTFSRLNSINAELIDLLDQVYKKYGIEPRILLDPDLIGINRNVRNVIELEYWGGPPFSASFDDLKPGVTIHQANETEKIFNQISQTQFWWKKSDDLFEFECEELIDSGRGENLNFWGCRYAHSLVDRKTNLISHLDGAVREYSESSYLDRLECRIDKCVDAEQYYKIWRLDGQIPIDVWKSLVSHHFRNNGLVREYLCVGEDKVDALLKQLPEKVDSVLDALETVVPARIRTDDHIEISVGYKPLKTWQSKSDIKILSTYEIDKGTRSAITNHGVEFLKLLQAEAMHAEHEKFGTIAFKDGYVELPMTVVFGSNSSELAGRVLKVAIEYISAINKSYSPIVSFTLAWHAKDKYSCISFFGVGSAFVKAASWVDFSKISEEKSEWANELATLMGSGFDKNKSVDLFSEARVNSAGWFSVPRIYIPNNWITLKADKESGALKYEISIPKGEEEILAMLKSSKIVPAVCWNQKQITCSICDQNYFDCPHTTCRHNASKKIADAEFLGAYWTACD